MSFAKQPYIVGGHNDMRTRIDTDGPGLNEKKKKKRIESHVVSHRGTRSGTLRARARGNIHTHKRERPSTYTVAYVLSTNNVQCDIKIYI